MMEVARVYSKTDTKEDGYNQTSLLGCRDFHTDLFTINGAVDVDFTLFIVRSLADTFNKGAFCRGGRRRAVAAIIIIIKRFVHEVLAALGSACVYVVAHVVVGTVVRAVFLLLFEWVGVRWE
jgi:hypothetical protein